MIERRWLASLALVLIAGCSLIPDAPLPAPPVPAQWPGESNAPRSPSIDPHPLPWKSFYDQPVLHDLITSALEANRDLQAAIARMEKAAALSGVALAARGPAIQAEAGHQAVRTPAGLGSGQAASIARRQDLEVALPAFELDFWGRLASLEEAAKSTFLASAETASAVRILLISQVMETFITWQEIREELFITQRILETRQELKAMVSQQVAAGVTTAQTEWRAAMELEKVHAEWLDWLRQEAVTKNALKLLTGYALDETLTWPGLGELDWSTHLQWALPAEVLATRPDVRAAEHRLMAANAHIGAARAAFWPRIALTTSLGTASRELSGLFNQGSMSWSFMPKLEIPIFDFSRRKSELAVVEAEHKVLLAEYEKVLQQAFREVADALASRALLLERLHSRIATRDAQQARLDLIRERFQAGVDGKQALLDAEGEFYVTEQSIRSAQKAVLINQVVLYKALGGGVD